MKVLKITETEDGGAILDLEMSNEEQNILIEYAVVDLLKKYIEKLNNKQEKELEI